MRDTDDDPTTNRTTHPTTDSTAEEWPEPPNPFRGVFDFNPWAANGRDSRTGRTIHPHAPAHVCVPSPDGSYELRPQIAHRLSWWLGGMRDRAGFPAALYLDYDGSPRQRAMWL